MKGKSKILFFCIFFFMFLVVQEIDASNIKENYVKFEKKELKSFGYEEKNLNSSAGIVDDNLKKALNEAYNNENSISRPLYQDITIKDMISFDSYLDLSSKGIKDLTGMEYAINVKFLDLGENDISDVSKLAKLRNMLSLSLNDNQISDISPLTGLSSLENFILSGNDIEEISSISTMKNLKTLNIANNRVNDISILSGLTNLEMLFLNDNKIDDISSLKNLTKLIHLSISNNQINDISAISNLTKIKMLYAGNNQISDISAISGLTELKLLDMSKNKIVNLEPLTKITKLENLNLSNNLIKTTKGLNNLDSLSILNLQNNSINDLSGISNDKKIQNLHLAYNQIEDLSPLSSLDNLKNLEINFNSVKSLEPLKNLSTLESLSFQYNYISDISPLSNLYNLKHIEGYYNQISDLSPLKYLGLDPNNALLYKQNIKVEDPISYNVKNEIEFKSYDIDGTEYDVDFDDVKEGTNVYIGTWDNGGQFNGTVEYTYTYEPLEKSNENPVINFDKNQSIELNDKKDDKDLISLFNVTSFDYEDRDISEKIKVNQSSIKYDEVGKYQVIFSVLDSSGNLTEETAELEVLKNEIPILKGVEDVEIVKGTEFDPLEGVSAIDKEDGDITSNIKVYEKEEKEKNPEVEIYNYSVEDSTGNKIEVNRKVRYLAGPTNNNPVISGVNDVNVFVGDKFNPMDGVSVTDIEDGNLINKLIVSGSVDTLKVGNYKLTYSVIDSDNNAVSVDRNITVKDVIVPSNNKPIISGANDIRIKLGSDFDLMEGVTASDVEDGDITNLILINGKINTGVVGDYKIIYSVIDSDNNITSVSRVISVYFDEVDKPIIDENNKDNIDDVYTKKNLIKTGKGNIIFLFISLLLFVSLSLKIII